MKQLEDLQCDGLKIFQDKNLYNFTSDSVILANFVQKKADFAVEIGCGCGVVSILVQAKTKIKKILAFEIQKELAALCKENVLLNNLQEKIEVVCEDVKNFEKNMKKHSADIVFCNPPYFKPTNFAQSEVKKIAREEVALSLPTLCEIASKMLKSGGDFFVCYPASRVSELVVNLHKQNLAAKELLFTENGKNEVKTVFCRATKDGKFGTNVSFLETNEEDGTYLDKLKTKNFLT